MSELIIAVPSKGRLEEKVSALFNEAGLPLVRPARGYEGRIEGIDGVRVFYLSANEIAKRLIAGEIHLGITGEDLLREQVSDADSAVVFLQKLGFGKADVVLASPDYIQLSTPDWILDDLAGVRNKEREINSMKDFANYATTYRKYYDRPLRVATKYQRLAGEFLLKHGVFDAVTEYSDGATEGAPASGAAEAIVDITSTGETLRANGLRVLDDGLILKSEANLIASRKATWSGDVRIAASQVFIEIEARMRAKELLQIKIVNIISGALPILEPFSNADHAEITKKVFLNCNGSYIGNNEFLIAKKNIAIARDVLLEETECDMVIVSPEQKMLYAQTNKLYTILSKELDKK